MAAKRKTPAPKKATKRPAPKVKRKDRPKPRPKATGPHRAAPGSLRPAGKMNGKVKAAIVAELAQTWDMTGACFSNNISLETLRRHRRDDPEFAAAIDEAHERYCELLRKEVHRRAVDGISKPVYYKGDIVGYVQEFSDSLLTLHIRRHDKGYVDTVKVDQNTKLEGSLVNVKASLAELAPEVREQLRKLVEAQRKAAADD